MKDFKKMIINFLMEEYDELEATQQVCFAEIEIAGVIKITYDNGVVEYLEHKGDKVVKYNVLAMN
jgi:hypothetical protein